MKSDVAQAKKDVLREVDVVDVLHGYVLAGGMRSHAEQISPDQANGEIRPKKAAAAQTASPEGVAPRARGEAPRGAGGPIRPFPL